jgi:hypothetical protein
VRQKLLASLVILLVATLALAISAAAAEETPEPPKIAGPEPAPEQTPEAAEEEEPEGFLGRFSGALQVDLSNAYFFRGILQDRGTFVVQPWGEGYFTVYSAEEGFVRDFSVGGGIWSSFHTSDTLATEDPRSLYEIDYYPIVSFEFLYGVGLTFIYYWYDSPNGAFEHVEEFNIKLNWDDSEYLKCFALQPWINIAIETHKTSFGDKQGKGMQMGIEPTLFEVPVEDYPITITAPAELGIALDDYYEEDNGSETTFGYASYGLKASVPLAFMPEKAGSWTFSVSGKGYTFSDTLKDANRGDRFAGQGVASLGVEF